MFIQRYIAKLNNLFQRDNTSIRSYWDDLQNLIMSVLPDVLLFESVWDFCIDDVQTAQRWLKDPKGRGL